MSEVAQHHSSPPPAVTHLTPKRRKLVPLRETFHRAMPGSGSPPRVGDVAPGHAAGPSGSPTPVLATAYLSSSAPCSRRARCLDNIDPSYTAMSGLCAASEVGTPRGGSIRIQHVTAAAAAAASSAPGLSHHAPHGAGSSLGEDAPARFPRLDECAHFHYDHVELGPLQVRLYEEELKPLGVDEAEEEVPWCVQVTSQGRAWLLRRGYRDFCTLDRQLHRCIYDRKFSALSELQDQPPQPQNNESQEDCTRRLLSSYLGRFSQLAGSLINCGPVLSWLELDNRGHRLIVTEDNAINTPAVAAAYAVRRYVAQAADEISFEVGDMISVIDMPPPEESIWWRGKRGFEVGFFPCDTVAVIGDKVPKNLHLSAAPPSMNSNPIVSPPVVSAPLAAAAVTSAMALPSKPVLRKHGKLIAFFRSFILNRPSRRRLKQSGILKERVFGCDLGEHLLNSGHDIPMVLKCCAEFIEESGIVDGIYRLSGVTSNIQKLRNAFDEDRIPALYEDEAISQDIHSVASLLKMYFRELPNPLCTYQLYQQFVNAVQANEKDRLLKMREAVQKLPPPHYRTLEYLIGHLARVASRGNDTGMTPRNVAIVWAPNLLRCKELEVGGVAALQGVGVQAVVTEYLVCCADLIFCDKLPAAPNTPPISEQAVSTLRRTNRPKSLAISTPTKLLSLEEARTRALGMSGQEFIEVGGGPSKLPEKYHTVIELPSRKRGSSLKAKRSPLGWRSLFGGSKARASSARPAGSKQGRKSNTPTDLEQCGIQSEVLQPKRPLRPVKSAESLGSGGGSSHNSNRNSAALELDGSTMASPDSPSVAGPLPSMLMMQTSFLPAKPSHNRSVSHDSYFDHLADQEDNDEESLDLSEIQLNFELEDNEMRIFSEDETLISTSAGSPCSTMSQGVKLRTHPSPRHCTRARLEELSMSSADPSPKKNKKSSTSPGARKRSKMEAARSITPHTVKVEDELRFIDSQSPEPGGSTIITAEVHESPPSDHSVSNAGATVSENESMTLHSSESSGLTTPSSPPCYAPLVSDTEQPSTGNTPGDATMSLEGLYENIASGNWDQIVVAPDSKLLYQNLMTVKIDPEDNVYEDVQTGKTDADPEEVYQQVKAFRRSVAEVNELMLADGTIQRVMVAADTRKSWSPLHQPAVEVEDTRKSWSPLHQPVVESEDLRRRFESEIGRDIVRERRMKTELERMRADSSPCSLNTVSSPDKQLSDTRLTVSPPSSLTCLSAASGELSPQTTAAPLLPETEGSLTSLSSATSFSPSTTSPPLSENKSPDLSPTLGKSMSSKSQVSSECSDSNVNLDCISPTTQNSELLLSPVSPVNKEHAKFILSPILSSEEFSESPEFSSQRKPPVSLNLSKSSQARSPSPDNTSLDLSRLQESPNTSCRDTPTSFASTPGDLSPISREDFRPAPPSYPNTPLLSPTKSSPETKSTSTKSSPISPEHEKAPESWDENSSSSTLSPKLDSSQNSFISDEVELRNNTKENTRPKSAPSQGKSSLKVHVTLTSRRSSEPAKSLSLADTRRLENRKASVKELLNRFEGTNAHKSMPPCLRAKAAKGQLASNMSASLDEDRFNEHARELVRVQTSPDVAIQDDKNEEDKSEITSKNEIARNLLSNVNLDDPERRERIEKYKEERRNFLREKYRSESFRGERDDIVTRLKQKTLKQPMEEEFAMSRSVSANERLSSMEGIRSRSQSESSSSIKNRHPTSPTYSLKDNMGALFETASETHTKSNNEPFFPSV